MHRFSSLQNIVKKVRSQSGKIPETAINVFLTVFLEPGVTLSMLSNKLNISHDEALHNISILMTSTLPNDNSIGLMYMDQDEALFLTPNGEKLTEGLAR